jgi:hypothetical protein
MRKTLCDGAAKFEILEGKASILKFADLNAALFFLRGLRSDREAFAVFREAMGQLVGDVDRLNEDQVLDRYAVLLVSGRVRILRSCQPAIGSAVGEALSSRKKEEEEGLSAQQARVPKKHWVEFRVVDDKTGDPIEGVQLTVRMPDGSTEIQTTDAGGYVEFVEILKGECFVTCDMTDARLSNSFQFVRVS